MKQKHVRATYRLDEQRDFGQPRVIYCTRKNRYSVHVILLCQRNCFNK